MRDGIHLEAVCGITTINIIHFLKKSVPVPMQYKFYSFICLFFNFILSILMDKMNYSKL